MLNPCRESQGHTHSFTQIVKIEGAYVGHNFERGPSKDHLGQV